jgi:PAS domain S-box-containing protein
MENASSQEPDAIQSPQQKEETFRSVFENTPAGLYRTTPAGQIVMINRALAKMLGYSGPEELTSRNLGADLSAGIT